MRSTLLRLAAISVLALVGACGQEQVKVPPEVTIAVDPAELANDGTATTTVSVTAKDENGKAADGDVVVTASAGFFEGEKPLKQIVRLTNGAGSVTFSCDKAKDSKCVESVKFTAVFGDVTAVTTLTIKDAAASALAISFSQPRVYAGLGETTVATLQVVDGKGADVKREFEVALTVDNAKFKLAGAATTKVKTDASGKASAEIEVGAAGMVKLTAQIANASGGVLAQADGSFEVVGTKFVITRDDPTDTQILAGVHDSMGFTAQLADVGGTAIKRSAVNVAAKVEGVSGTGVVKVNARLKALVTDTTGVEMLPQETDANGQVKFVLVDDIPEAQDKQELKIRVNGANPANAAIAEATISTTAYLPVLKLTNDAGNDAAPLAKLYDLVDDQATLKARLEDNAGQPAKFAKVAVTLGITAVAPANPLGILVDATTNAPVTTAETDANGEVRFKYRARTALGVPVTVTAPTTVEITASMAAGIKKASSVQVLPVGVTATVTPASALAGVGDSVVVKATLSGPAAAAGVDVTFSSDSPATGGGLFADPDPLVPANSGRAITIKTKSTGEAVASYSPGSADAGKTVNITVKLANNQQTAGTVSVTAPYLAPPTVGTLISQVGFTKPLTFSMVKSQTLSDPVTRAGIEITCVATQSGGVPPSNTGFRDPAGTSTIFDRVKLLTDSSGTITPVFVPGNATGSINVDCNTSGNALGTKTLALTLKAPLLKITDPLGGTGQSFKIVSGAQRVVTAQLVDDQGASLSSLGAPSLAGRDISFKASAHEFVSLTDATNVNNPMAVKADANGEAKVYFRTKLNDTATTALITATYIQPNSLPNNQTDGANTVSATVDFPAMQVTATRTRMLASVGQTNTVTMQVMDAAKTQPQAISGFPVTFNLTFVPLQAGAARTGGMIDPSTNQPVTSLSLTTDSQGKATVTVNPGTDLGDYNFAVTSPRVPATTETAKITTELPQVKLTNVTPSQRTKAYTGVKDYLSYEAILWDQLAGAAINPTVAKGIILERATGTTAHFVALVDPTTGAVGTAATSVRGTTACDTQGANCKVKFRFIPDDTSTTSATLQAYFDQSGSTKFLDTPITVVQPTVELSSAAPRLTTSISSTTTLTARLADRSTTPSTPLAYGGVNVLVEIAGTGTASLASGSSTGRAVTVATDATGQLTVTLRTGDETGTLSIAAKNPATAAGLLSTSVSLPLDLPQVQVTNTTTSISAGRGKAYTGIGDFLTFDVALLDQNSASPTVPLNLAGKPIVLERTSSNHYVSPAGTTSTSSLARTNTACDANGQNCKASFKFIPDDASASVGSASLVAYFDQTGSPKSNPVNLTVVQPTLEVTSEFPRLTTSIGASATITTKIADKSTSTTTYLTPSGVQVRHVLTRSGSTNPATLTSGTTTGGDITLPTSSGVITSTLKTGDDTSAVTIAATAPGMVGGSASVSLDPPSVQVSYASTKSKVYSGVKDFITVNAQLIDAQNNPVLLANKDVQFTALGGLLATSTAGTLVSTPIVAKTNSSGVATVVFTPDDTNVASAGAVKAGFGSSPATLISGPNITIVKPTIVASSSTNALTTSVGQTAALQAKLVDPSTSADLAFSGASLGFNLAGTSGGTASLSPTSATTGATGVASGVTFNPGTDTGNAQITVSAPGMTTSQSVTIALSLPQVALSAAGGKTTLYSGIADTVVLSGQLVDASNTPIAVANKDVTFQVPGPYQQLQAGTTTNPRVTAKTNSSGIAQVTFVTGDDPAAGPSTSVTVTSNFGANPATLPYSLGLTVKKPTLTVTGRAQMANGVGSTSQLSVTITDAGSTITTSTIPATNVTLQVFASGSTTAPTGRTGYVDSTGNVLTQYTLRTGGSSGIATFVAGDDLGSFDLKASASGMIAGSWSVTLVQPQVDISQSKTKVFTGLGDVASITAQLVDPTIAGRPALAAINKDIKFDTNFHKLKDSLGALFTLGTVKTDSTGKAAVQFVPQNSETANLSAIVGAQYGTSTKAQLNMAVEVPKLVLTQTKTVMPTAVADTATFTGAIKDASGGAISGLTLSGVGVTFQVTPNPTDPKLGFTTSGGGISGGLQVTSDAAGAVQVTYNTGAIAGAITTVVSAPGMTGGNLTVDQKGVFVSLTPTSGAVYNGVNDSLTLTGQLRYVDGSTNGQPIAKAGIGVSFATSSHLFSNGANNLATTTTETGAVTAVFQPQISDTATSANVTAWVTLYGSANPTPVASVVSITNLQINVSALKTSLNSGTSDSTVITAQLVKGGSTVAPVQGVALTFSTDNGAFQTGTTPAPRTTTVATDVNGVATATFLAQNDVGDANVVVSRSGLTTNPNPLRLKLVGSGVKLTVNPTKLYVNVGQFATLTAQIIDGSGNPSPQAGVNITFSTTAHKLAGYTATPVPGTTGTPATTYTVATDSTGKAMATFVTDNADSSTTAAITAANGTQTNTQTVNVSRLSIALSTGQNTLTTGINDNTTVTARLRDGTTDIGQAGVSIDLSTGLGSFQGGTACVAPLSGTSCIQVTTDAAGVATAQFNAGNTNGTANLTASRSALNPGTATITLQPVNISITTAKARLFTGITPVDSTTGEVTLLAGTTPQTNASFTLSTSAGTLVNGATTGTTLTLTTNTSGKATFALRAPATATTVTLTASYANATGTKTVAVEDITGVVLVGTAPTLGVKGSGINETGQLKFQVNGSTGPVTAGIPIAFSITSNTGDTGQPTAATLSNAQPSTDSSGQATVTLNAGTKAGLVTVQASSGATSTSPQVSVRWNRPSAAGLSLTCDKVNLDAYNTATGIKQMSVPCHVSLAERDTSALRVATSLKFKSEGGTLPPEITAAAGTNNIDFLFSTSGNGPGSNTPLKRREAIVDPLASPQEIFPIRPSEPVNTVNGKHPRARYLTFVVWTMGEERFKDVNGNGVWEKGEVFTDTARKNGVYDPPERFVDVNGNGAWDVGENFLDTNGDGQWTAGESFVDNNGNGEYEPSIDGFTAAMDTARKNGLWDDKEPFTDSNANGTWDTGEPFTDKNGDGVWNAAEAFTDAPDPITGQLNGVYDGPEPLTDLGEPFADSNDNGWWDPGEPFEDLVDAQGRTDNQWTPPNGKWDQVTGIWKPYTFVYSGGPANATPLIAKFEPATVDVPAGGTASMALLFADDFFNPLAKDTNVTVTRTGGRGTFALLWASIFTGTGPTTAAIKDGYGGNGPLYKEVGLHLGSTCLGEGATTGREPVCVVQTYFDSWPDSSGYAGTVQLSGGQPQQPGEVQTFTATATTNGSSVSASATVNMLP